MTLDVALVCPSCRRFWHGEPGTLPFPSPRGVVCSNEGHALRRRPATVVAIAEAPLDRRRVTWLTADDLDRARRNAGAAAARGLPHSRGEHESPALELERRTHAFEAEAAVARFTGEAWNNADGEAGGADVGADIDVKWRSETHWDLIIRPEDDARRRFVLVRGYWPDDLWLAGWIHGTEAPALATVRVWARNSRDHWVEADKLRPIASLECRRQ